MAPTTLTNSLLTEKNAQVNAPIFLYEVQIDNVGGELDIAEYDQTVVFGGKTYTPFPVTHEAIPMNISGEIDMLRVTVANVNQAIGAYLLANNGMRGNQVVMKLVFADLLTDSNAHIDNLFYIDGVVINETAAVFSLTSKLDLLQVQIPMRSFIRDYCPWPYRGDGCWIWVTGTLTAPAGWANDATQCDKTRAGAAGCIFHNNQLRFGGFPTMPAQRVYVI